MVYDGPVEDQELVGCVENCMDFTSIQVAQRTCEMIKECNGITFAQKIVDPNDKNSSAQSNPNYQATGPLNGWGW